MADNRQQAERLHQEMLQQMRDRGIFTSSDVEAAFVDIPRHLFLPHLPLEQVYKDVAIGLKSDTSGLLTSSSSQPTMMAYMLNQLGLKDGDNVLEIGTASGYNAAIMQHIVGGKGSVTSIEIDKELATSAQENLHRARVSRVNVVHGDGAQGYAPRASYDHIISTVGVWDIPPNWMTQLKPQGTLVVPIVIDGIQISAKLVPQSDGTALSVDNRPCAFVYMLGTNAGPNFRRQIGSTGLFILADELEKIDTAALALLLSDDHEYCQFDTVPTLNEFWYGYQIYLMLHEPERYVFFVYSVYEGQKAFGIEGRGVGLYTKGTVSLAGYDDRGLVHCIAGSDAFLEMQNAMDAWEALNRPMLDQLRFRLIPKEMGKPEIERGKLYERPNNYLHLWLEV